MEVKRDDFLQFDSRNTMEQLNSEAKLLEKAKIKGQTGQKLRNSLEEIMSKRRNTIAVLNRDVFGSMQLDSKNSFTNIQFSGRQKAAIETLRDTQNESSHFLQIPHEMADAAEESESMFGLLDIGIKKKASI